MSSLTWYHMQPIPDDENSSISTNLDIDMKQISLGASYWNRTILSQLLPDLNFNWQQVDMLSFLVVGTVGDKNNCIQRQAFSFRGLCR